MLTKDFHPAQLTYIIESRRTAKYGNIATFVLGVSACVVCILPSHWSLKISNIAIASGLFITSYKLEKLQKWGEDYRHATNHESIKGYAQHLNTSFAPPRREIAIAPPVELATPVKYAPIESSLKKPHLMILGETGSGKSTICKYLVSQVNAPCLIIDPHASPTDWRGFVVTGSGRNYSDIATEFERLANLMQIRYEARDKGISQFDPLIVIIDEFPAIASSLGKGATDTVKLLAREARKVSIRMCLLSQGAEVKTLGLEGEGSIRECFAMLRLGNFALSHGKSLKDKAIGEVMETCDRPAMLDQLPCNLPILSDAQTMPVLPLPNDYLELVDASPIAPPSVAIAAQPQSTAIAPIFTKIINYLDGRDWTRDNVIKQSITDFKNADTPIEELQGYLQFLEVSGHLETRGAGRNGLEARKI